MPKKFDPISESDYQDKRAEHGKAGFDALLDLAVNSTEEPDGSLLCDDETVAAADYHTEAIDALDERRQRSRVRESMTVIPGKKSD